MASFFKRARKRVKRIGRKVLKVHAKVAKVVRPVASFAAGVAFGPLGSAAVTSLSHYGHQYSAATTARSKGIRGREARTIGRTAAQRTTMHSIYAGGVGVVGAGVVGGLGAAATGLVGQSVTGLGSGAGLFGLTNPFMTATSAGTALSTGTALTTGSLGIQTWDSLYNKTGTVPTVPVEGAQTWDSLFGAATNALGGGSDAGGGGAAEQGAGGSYPFGTLNADGAGDGQPSNLTPILLGVGALLLLGGS